MRHVVGHIGYMAWVTHEYLQRGRAHRSRTNAHKGAAHIGHTRCHDAGRHEPRPHGTRRYDPCRYDAGRTTPRISIDPAPAIVTFRPGRGACTIAPPPTYIPTWLASL